MAQSQQEPGEDWMFPVDPDLFSLDSFEQANQKQNLFDWFSDIDNATYGNIAFDDQKDQPAEDGLPSIPFDIGDSIPRNLLNNGELELESYFGLADTSMLPVANPGLQMAHRPPTDFVARYFDPTLAASNCDTSDSWEYQSHTPMTTVPQRSEPCHAEVTSLNAFVDPNSILKHLAIEHGTVAGGSSQATDLDTPKNNVREQLQLSHDASLVRHERPVRRKRTTSKPLFPGCLTLDLGFPSATAKKLRKRKMKEECEMTKTVKSRSACLRCRFEKQKIILICLRHRTAREFEY
ncbi:hypothetical protein EPUS_08214 [Endocarpon pusillum Z07020]|uniref:Uncharacterized protein n=1 Tax=Endocarpon pusillum (strain Z07020 / HMAS-L-300199) TaxID=1263415 RepID=U1G851_ENDPU|nr:uncharacterized protein EPUS_08214 [Endocarpon pusillum Z07020]ERF68148.1 hypothetical protein EPUS_08214 [Endocarpon pusillum Z07020]